MTRIFHISTAPDWSAAQESGRYTTSTRGRTLAEEGFLHACRGDQWEGVRQRFYADVSEPLVLLVIDPARLGVPVIEESVGDSPETFPHIYGALDPSAVVQTISLNADSNAALPYESFSRVFFREMFFNLMLAVIVLACVVGASAVGVSLDSEWGALVGTGVGFGVGLPLAIGINRQRRDAEARSAVRQ